MSDDDRSSRGTRFGRYRLIEQIGSGGMGVVWKALDTGLNRTVAVKQIREDALTADSAARFHREARVAARLRHPHIVAVYDVGECDGRVYLTMDLVEGRTLEALLDETRKEKQGRARRAFDRLRDEVFILADVADAVGYAHREGVVHRDLKPGNVLIDAEGRAQVTDFGLAKEVAGTVTRVAGARAAAALTRTGQALGTPAYMSPEMAIADEARVGPPADVWALGVMLYEVLTGRTPFEDAGEPWEVMGAVARAEPVAPRRRHAAVPFELEAVCLRALEKEPAQRYADGAAFAEELRRWLRGDPVDARPPGWLARVRRTVRRHRGAVAAGAVLLVFLGVAAAYLWAAARAGKEARRARAEADRLSEEVLGALREIADVCVEEALAARRRGRLEPARRLAARLAEACEQARARLPGRSPEPDFHLGRVRLGCLEDGSAAESFRRALEAAPEWLPAANRRAVLPGASPADVERAVRLAGTVVAGGTEEAWLGPARRKVLRALTAGADGEAARAALRSAVEADPDLEEAWRLLARLECAAGRWAEAEAVATRALERDRGCVGHRLCRAEARLGRGEAERASGADPAASFAGAREDVEAVLAVLPAHPEAAALRDRVRGAAGK